MIESARLIALAVMAVAGMRLHSGVASQYAPGVMATVITNRLNAGQLASPLPEVEGYAAALD